MDAATRRHASFAATFFFLSGATALVYEVVWFRRFAALWGSSSLAMAAVLAAFLLGLGLGARALGPLADRMRRPLLGYAACEAAIGLWALAMPRVLDLLAVASASLRPALPASPLAGAALELALAFVALAPPCIAMGATLPFLVRDLAACRSPGQRRARADSDRLLAPERGGLGVPTSLLYSINAAGAAAGALAAGFALLPALGLARTQLVAALANLAIALLVLPLARARPLERGEHAAASPASFRAPSAGALALAAGAAGFAALVLQIVWARQLAILLGGSTYAFSAMLALVLLGIAAGSLVLPSLLRHVHEPTRLVAPVALLSGAALAAGQALIPALSEVAGDVGHLRASQLFNAALCCFASAALELVPAGCAGLLFPLFVHLAGGEAASAGRTVGRVYAWNTLGTALGAILAHALLVPLLGTRGALLLALGLVFLAAALASMARTAAQVGYALVLVAALVFFPRLDPLETERGLYLYGPAGRAVFANAELVFHAEGSHTNVLVTEHAGEHVLRVNGKVDASTYALDQVVQLGLAYYALFLRPDARELFVIGYGSGATAGACLQWPGTRVTCAEIEREVFRASPYFASVNHGPELASDFEILFADGRAHLASTEREYDLILSEPSNPWMSGVSSLFTREFFELARARLAPGGMYAHWIQTYALAPREYRSILRTLAAVFPHLALARLGSGDTMVLASEQPIVPPPEVIARAAATVASAGIARADLARWFASVDVRALLLQHLVLGGDELRALASEGEGLITDANLRLEFDAPRRLFERETEPGERVEAVLLRAARATWTRELARALGCGPESASALTQLASTLRASGNEGAADELIALGLELAPDDPALQAERLIHVQLDEAEVAASAARLAELAAPEAMRVAAAAAGAGDAARALVVLDRILERLPDSLTARAHRALALWNLERRDEARAELEALVALDPLHEAVRAAVRELRAADPSFLRARHDE